MNLLSSISVETKENEYFEEEVLPAENIEPSARRVPWAGVAHKLDKYNTWKRSRLNFEVEKRPLQALKKGRLIDVSGHFATVRKDTDEPLGVVQSRYNVQSNKELFELGNVLQENIGAEFVSEGLLGGGEKVFITLRLPETLNIPGAEIEQNFMLLSSHDGSTSLTVANTPINLRCLNATWLAIREANQVIRLRHTDSISSRVDKLKSNLDQIVGYYPALAEELIGLSKQAFSKSEFNALADKLYPENGTERSTKSKNDLANLRSLFNKAEGAHEVRNTKLSGLRAITQHSSHEKTTRSSEKFSAEENRFRSLLSGSGNSFIQRGYKMLKAA